ncbi:hypothetical protein [Streptomyces sp. NPDC093707]|uniref:hypothetical protein n=1 Tax=Streptomyces sp. NPDC093707 TaxID=3154984 RepID=UPI00344FF32B
MKRILPVLFLAAAVLLTGCGSSGHARPSGPPTTTVTPSRADTDLADRYRKAGGDTDVYGIDHAKNAKGTIVLRVWTRRKNYDKNFDGFAAKLASFLTREGIHLNQGYVLNVYSSDGTRLHNYDTTPEGNP